MDKTATTPTLRKCRKCPAVLGCPSRCPLHLKKEDTPAAQDCPTLSVPCPQASSCSGSCPVAPLSGDVIDALQYANLGKGSPVMLGLDMVSDWGSYTALQYSRFTGEDGSPMVVQYAGEAPSAATMIALAPYGLEQPQDNIAAYNKAAEDAAALELLRTLKAQQAERPRMIAVVGQGTLGRWVVGYLQQRGIAAIALGPGSVPAHLREGVKELPLEQLQLLYNAIPAEVELQEQRAQQRVEVKAIQAGRALQGIQAALQQPKQPGAKQLAKQAKREENKQRTLAGQQRAKALLTAAGQELVANLRTALDMEPWQQAQLEPSPELLDFRQRLATAEAGLVIPVPTSKTAQ